MLFLMYMYLLPCNFFYLEVHTAWAGFVIGYRHWVSLTFYSTYVSHVRMHKKINIYQTTLNDINFSITSSHWNRSRALRWEWEWEWQKADDITFIFLKNKSKSHFIHCSMNFFPSKLFQAFRAVPKIGSIFTTNFWKRWRVVACHE